MLVLAPRTTCTLGKHSSTEEHSRPSLIWWKVMCVCVCARVWNFKWNLEFLIFFKILEIFKIYVFVYVFRVCAQHVHGNQKTSWESVLFYPVGEGANSAHGFDSKCFYSNIQNLKNQTTKIKAKQNPLFIKRLESWGDDSNKPQNSRWSQAWWCRERRTTRDESSEL